MTKQRQAELTKVVITDVWNISFEVDNKIRVGKLI